MGNTMSQRPGVSLSSHELPTQPALNFHPNPGNKIGISSVPSALALLEYLARANNGSNSPPNYAQSLEYTEHLNEILAFLGDSNEMETSLTHFGITKIHASRAAKKLNEQLENLKTARGNIGLEAELLEAELESNIASIVDACRNIMQLFQDRNGQLQSAPLPASELLINFAAIYAETAIRCASALPSQKQTLQSCLTGLLQIMRSCMETCIPARMSMVKLDCSWKKPMGTTPWIFKYRIVEEEEMLRFVDHPPPWVIPSVHLGDAWPTSVKGLDGKTVIEPWKWNGQGDMKGAIRRTCHYRRQVQVIYTECFEKAIQAVDEISKRLA